MSKQNKGIFRLGKSQKIHLPSTHSQEAPRRICTPKQGDNPKRKKSWTQPTEDFNEKSQKEFPGGEQKKSHDNAFKQTQRARVQAGDREGQRVPRTYAGGKKKRELINYLIGLNISCFERYFGGVGGVLKDVEIKQLAKDLKEKVTPPKRS